MPRAVDPGDQRIAELEALLKAALARIAELEARVAALTARLNQNSTNSSKPPSSDPSGVERTPKPPTGRKPGGQPGHKRTLRELVPAEQVHHIHELRPSTCCRCARRLRGDDPDPLRHQVTELPVVRSIVTEYRLHLLACECGAVTRAQLPAGVPRGAFGPVLSSMVALCTVRFRQSKRLAQELLSTMLNVEVSLGAISKIEQQTSEALAAPVEEAREYVREQAVANADETGWYEGKADGRKRRAWLWVVTTSLVTVFRIAKSHRRDGSVHRAYRDVPRPIRALRHPPRAPRHPSLGRYSEPDGRLGGPAATRGLPFRVCPAVPDLRPRRDLRHRGGRGPPVHEHRADPDELPEPWQNGTAERFVATVRRELLDQAIVLGEGHLRQLLGRFLDYYQVDRTHLGLDKDSPFGRPVELRPSASATVVGLPRVGGLHRRYAWRQAA